MTIVRVSALLAAMMAASLLVNAAWSANWDEDAPILRLQSVEELPALEAPFAADPGDYMTPVSDVMDADNTLETPAVLEGDMTPWTDMKSPDMKEPTSTMPDDTAKKKLSDEPLPASSISKQAIGSQAAMEPASPARAPAGKDPGRKKSEHKVSIQYAPLSAVAVFPVIRHRYERAFGDLPLLFSREFALKMEEKTPRTRVFHPVYTVEQLRAQGLGHIYYEVMEYYKKAGRPEPAALDYLMERLNDGSQPVARVIFVEADLDIGHSAANTGAIERVKGWMTDGLPKQQKYFVRSRVQVFNAQEPGYPMLWAYNSSEMVPGDAFYNYTASVFSDSDSQSVFAKASREISGEVLSAMPKNVYLETIVETGVHGEVISGVSDHQGGFSLPQTLRGLTQEDRNILRRILSRDDQD